MTRRSSSTSQVIKKRVASKTATTARAGLVDNPRLTGIPALGSLLANSPLEGGDLPKRKPARGLCRSEF
jgi:hypothetical protein